MGISVEMKCFGGESCMSSTSVAVSSASWISVGGARDDQVETEGLTREF